MNALVFAIYSAIAMREASLRNGRYHRKVTNNFAVEIGRLRAYAATNPYPSPNTIRAFFQGQLYKDLLAVVPGNKAGDAIIKKLYNAYRQDLEGTQVQVEHGGTPA